MPRHFERRGPNIRATFATGEVALLRQLQDVLQQTLDGGDAADDGPAAPALRRLFPSAVLDDPDADVELRASLHTDLLASRLERLDALGALLDRAEPSRGDLRVDLVDDEPLLLLGVLNDLRLTLGALIDIEALDRDHLTDAEPPTYPEAVLDALAIIDHLAGMQERLLAIIDPVSTSHYDEPGLHDLP